MGENVIDNYVALALKNSDLINYEVKLKEENNKGEGFICNVLFVTVEGTTQRGESKSLHLALKISPDNEMLRKVGSIGEATLKEVHIYDVVKVAFEKFQQEKGLEPQIKFMPLCYATVVESSRETLVFENLKMQGFELNNKAIPMTLKHVRLVLEAYGQWHALSMALKKQQPSVFGKITENNINVFYKLYEAFKLNHSAAELFLAMKNHLISDEEASDFKHLQFSSDDILNGLKEKFFDETEHHVILHGDCWNNNFLFKTANNPSEVRILDWQCSGLSSPVFDLSYFIFCCMDTERNQDVTEVLKIYHESLSKHLTSYGCAPEEIYPFDKLLEEWKRFSRFGLFVSLLCSKICVNTSKVFSLSEKVKQKNESFDLSAEDHDNLLKRVKNNFVFYCKNVEV